MPAIAWARLMNAGQGCLQGKHIYVERSIAAEFADRMHQCVGFLDVDDPMKIRDGPRTADFPRGCTPRRGSSWMHAARRGEAHSRRPTLSPLRSAGPFLSANHPVGRPTRRRSGARRDLRAGHHDFTGERCVGGHTMGERLPDGCSCIDLYEGSAGGAEGPGAGSAGNFPHQRSGGRCGCGTFRRPVAWSRSSYGRFEVPTGRREAGPKAVVVSISRSGLRTRCGMMP